MCMYVRVRFKVEVRFRVKVSVRVRVSARCCMIRLSWIDRGLG